MIDLFLLGWICFFGLAVSYLCCCANYYLFTKEMPVRQHLSYYGLGITALCFGALMYQYILT